MPCSAQDNLNLCGSLRVGKFLKLFVQCLAEVIAKKMPKKAQVPFVKTPNKRTSLRIGDRRENNNKKKLRKGTVPTAAVRTEGVSGIENVFKAFGIRSGRRNPGPSGHFPSFFLKNPSKISGNIFKCYVWQYLALCIYLRGSFCAPNLVPFVFFFVGVGDVFLIQSVN